MPMIYRKLKLHIIGTKTGFLLVVGKVDWTLMLMIALGVRDACGTFRQGRWNR